MLDYDRIRNTHRIREGDSLHRRLGHVLLCEVSGRLSSRIVGGNVLPNDELLPLMDDGNATISNQKTEQHMNIDPKIMSLLSQ